MMGRENTHNVTFTEKSYKRMREFSQVLGFGSVAGFVQAAIIEYVTQRLPLIERFEK